MTSSLSQYNENTFERIKHLTEEGVEFWYARELQGVLEYAQWRNFEAVIYSSMDACETSGNNVSDHFADVSKIVRAGIAEKLILDYTLSRYACYLIVQNGNPRKGITPNHKIWNHLSRELALGTHP